MKKYLIARRTILALVPVFALALGGCANHKPRADVMAPPGPEEAGNKGDLPRLHVGDTVTITFGGLPEPLEMQEKPIKEDGTITLPDIGRVKAAGKTPGDLEDAIHDLYVPKFYTHLNVTVKTSNDRVYYVRGEVKSPGRMIYTGPITVSKAITSAGDFNDFASRKDVMLIRANGDRFRLNINKILDGEAPDPPVYPGDQIVVDRSIL